MKKREKAGTRFLNRARQSAEFGRDEDLLLFLQRIRDEAHRFAISFIASDQKDIAAIRAGHDSRYR